LRERGGLGMLRPSFLHNAARCQLGTDVARAHGANVKEHLEKSELTHGHSGGLDVARQVGVERVGGTQERDERVQRGLTVTRASESSAG